MLPLCSAFTRRAMMCLGALSILAAISAPATAQSNFPNRPVTLVVPFPAGGSTDLIARLVASRMTDKLGQQIIVENRGGAGGNIGIAAVKRLPADGYTLLVCSSAFVVNPSLYAQAAYDPLKDFIPLMVMGASPNVFVVPAQSPIKSMKEFIDKAKANPGKMNWTSPGAGTTPQLAGELLKLRTGIDMQHIPFPGAGPATNAVLAGTVDLYTANIGSVQGLIDGGKVRPIAVTATKRWAPLPDVPTLEEIGVKDAASDTFQGVYVLAGTPQPIVDRLAKELATILAKPDTREKFARIGLPVVAEGPAEFRKRVEREVPMFKEIIDKAGLKIP
jgi:tripartite-type tricarboxylate transporter receptor subunit TctC